ncbi:hypothetical protein [Niabella drilacis]|uniref:hypothetical protein n=1 Tax=Niabella drilacis (strain DSM 25811 / CCM 8410 / CCUG 62505 / LMG 26954 / E90) TaxID=1285928 RepID=UPI000B85EA65|nr:hypothetical protein [Niabella drilacis]
MDALYFILIVVYIAVVTFGIRALLMDKVLPAHLKVLGIIVVLIFNIIPVALYLLLRNVRSRDF